MYFLTAHMAEKNVMGKDLYQSQVDTIWIAFTVKAHGQEATSRKPKWL